MTLSLSPSYTSSPLTSFTITLTHPRSHSPSTLASPTQHSCISNQSGGNISTSQFERCDPLVAHASLFLHLPRHCYNTRARHLVDPLRASLSCSSTLISSTTLVRNARPHKRRLPAPSEESREVNSASCINCFLVPYRTKLIPSETTNRQQVTLATSSTKSKRGPVAFATRNLQAALASARLPLLLFTYNRACWIKRNQRHARILQKERFDESNSLPSTTSSLLFEQLPSKRTNDACGAGDPAQGGERWDPVRSSYSRELTIMFIYRKQLNLHLPCPSHPHHNRLACPTAHSSTSHLSRDLLLPLLLLHSTTS